MTAASASAFEPDRNEDVAQGITEMENFLATQVPASPVKTAQRAPQVRAADPVPTPRVRQRRDEVLEARELLKWQADDAPSRVETEKVRKLKRRVKEAAALRKLGEDPDMVAWRDQRAQRFATLACMTGVVIALMISSVGVQDSVTKALDAADYTVVWWFAYLTESAISLPLLSVVATQAYAAMRGHIVDRKSAEGKAMFRTEVWLLAYTLTLQCWPVFGDDFTFLKLVVHSLAPVVAVLSVWALPAISRVFAQLHKPATPPVDTETVTAADLQWSRADGSMVDPPTTTPRGASVEEHRAKLQQLIRNGALEPEPSAEGIRKALNCRAEVARQLRDELKGGQS